MLKCPTYPCVGYLLVYRKEGFSVMMTNCLVFLCSAEEEVESGESKAKIQERMKKLAAMGAIGMGTSAVGAGLRDVGVALSTAKSSMGDGKIDVKSIAKKADSKLTHGVPRETARYLRASSEEASPASPLTRKTPVSSDQTLTSASRTHYGRSGSVSSVGSQSSLPGSPAWSVTARAAATSSTSDESVVKKGVSGTLKSESLSPTPLSVGSRSDKSPSMGSVDETKSAAKSPLPHSSSAKSPAYSQIAKQNSEGANSAVKSSPFLAKQKSEEGTSSSVKASPFLAKEQGSSKPIASSSSSTKTPSLVSSPVLKPSASPLPKSSPPSPAAEDVDADPKRKYTLEELQKGTPSDVDPKKKEDYLKTVHFKKAFGVSPDAYAKYPEWKKVEMRKQAKIF